MISKGQLHLIMIHVHVGVSWMQQAITHGKSSRSGGGSGTSVGELGPEDAELVDIVCFRDICDGDVLDKRPSPIGTLGNERKRGRG